MAVLTWQTDDGPQERALGDLTVIGRVADCDIRLNDRQVSRKHACIRLEHGIWLFEDEGSSNGSLVNGTARTRWPCSNGDTIEIGPFLLVFRSDGDDGASAPEEAGGADDMERLGAMQSIDLSVAGAATGAKDSVDLQRRLHAGYEIARATAATLKVPDLLEQVITALLEIFDSADRGLILLVDQETDAVSRGAVKQRSGRSGDDVAVSDTALKRVIQTREAVLCADAQDDGRFAASQSIVDIGIRSMMIAPLVFRDNVFGAIYLDALQRVVRFQKDDLKLLTFAAAEVAAALANAELHQQMVKHARMAAMGETVAGLSHCIKNILQGVKTGSYLIDMGLEQGNLDRVGSGWQVVKKKNDFMEELVWDLLTLSKPREPTYAPADLNGLCAEICEIGSHREDGPDVAVDFKPDPAMPEVELDAKGIRRCVLNLVTNAVDACTKGGEATVETHAPADDGNARVVIRDTGCGMDEETLAKLFKVFFSTKGSKGTGLGLSVTKKIVEEHGGRLDVVSEKGKGTTFTMLLALVHEDRHS
ncbi:MAG: FHA domain-containing protein [Kiritimatiellae bacterium]|nr:FHA domain-containing protein [Kiritimatiellia bacterium]